MATSSHTLSDSMGSLSSSWCMDQDLGTQPTPICTFYTSTWFEWATLRSSSSSLLTAQATAGPRAARKQSRHSPCRCSRKYSKILDITHISQCWGTRRVGLLSSTQSTKTPSSPNSCWWIGQSVAISKDSANFQSPPSWSMILKTMGIRFGKANCYSRSYSPRSFTLIGILKILTGYPITSGIWS